MIDKDMVLVCVLSRLQTEGIKLANATPEHLRKTINEAIADLRLADETFALKIIEAMRSPRSFRAILNKKGRRESQSNRNEGA